MRLTTAAVLGTELAVLVVAGVLLGGWLDERYGTGPWLLLGGTAAGFGSGLAVLVRGLRRAEEPPVDS